MVKLPRFVWGRFSPPLRFKFFFSFETYICRFDLVFATRSIGIWMCWSWQEGPTKDEHIWDFTEPGILFGFVEFLCCKIVQVIPRKRVEMAAFVEVRNLKQLWDCIGKSIRQFLYLLRYCSSQRCCVSPGEDDLHFHIDICYFTAPTFCEPRKFWMKRHKHLSPSVKLDCWPGRNSSPNVNG